MSEVAEFGTAIALLSLVSAALRAALAVIAAWFCLRALDWLAGTPFARQMERLREAESPGLGLYLGLRFLAVTVAFALVFS